MTNVVVIHPKRTIASAKDIAQRIEVDRASAIAGLREAIENLARVSNEPGYGFAGRSVEDCGSGLSELETLDFTTPLSVESIQALSRRLERIADEFYEQILKSGRLSS